MLLLGAETINGYTAAAAERFAEGSHLLASGNHGGAIYLFGYVAELVVKAATYRLFGLGPSAKVEAGFRRSVEWMMGRDALKPRGPHDILRWAEWLLLSKPALTGAAYPLGLTIDFMFHAHVIDANWSPEMRYHRLAVEFDAALAVQTSTRWVMTLGPAF